jgi:hypothetical protein
MEMAVVALEASCLPLDGIIGRTPDTPSASYTSRKDATHMHFLALCSLRYTRVGPGVLLVLRLGHRWLSDKVGCW